MGKYGYFDEEKKEYVITDPLPPRPWINYLTNSRMGAFISQGAGGLAWYHQPVSGRISRYNFMVLPEDRPGFYIYIREEDGTYWNPSFQPCQTPLNFWECRHGMGYTKFLARHKGIKSELTFFVPQDEDVMVFDLRVKNTDRYKTKLFISNYLEFSLFEYYKEVVGWIVLRNQIRFLYNREKNIIKYYYFVHEAENTNPVFLTSTPKPDCFECDRQRFIGRGRDTSNPESIEKGTLSDSQLPGGGVGIASLGYHIELAPGEEKRIIWTLGAGKKWEDAEMLAEKYQDPQSANEGYKKTCDFWDSILSILKTDIPDGEIRNMVNIWNPYGSYATFFRDRDISTELPGFATGIRFRDAMQNNMSMCTLHSDTARERTELLLAHQRADGSAIDRFLPGDKEKPASSGAQRCDNSVWPPITVYLYLGETGDLNFLNKKIPYMDKGEDTVYNHLMAGLKQIVRDSGPNGLPLLKGRDWDDHLELFKEEGAESVMTTQNWCYAARQMKEICNKCGKSEDASWIDRQLKNYTLTLNTAAWDGEWYRQVLFTGDKVPLGSRKRRENKIYINTQAWAVISGTAPEERAVLCMNKMREYLNTSYGIRFLTPPYTGIPEPEDPLVSNGPGLGENGGVFVQANCWAIMAETFLGRGDIAYEYYRKIAPPIISEEIGPDIYLNEPYMYSSHIVAEPDIRKGMANLSWLTGSVNWMYIVATQHILGIRPTLNGLTLKPCIPSEWEGFRAKRIYRKALYDISVKRGTVKEERLKVDGKPVRGTLIPVVPEGKEAQIELLIPN